MYFKGTLVKLELGIGKEKKLYDKRKVLPNVQKRGCPN